MNSFIRKIVSNKEFGIFLLLLGLCALVTMRNPVFLSSVNLQNTSRLVGMFGIFSIGLGLVIITGGIDLSVGSAMALQGVLLSILLNERGWSPASGILVVLVLGAFLGAVHGLLVTRARMQPFIVTLCGLLIYRGLARYIANDETKGFGQVPGFDRLQTAATGALPAEASFGVPVPFLLLMIIGLVMWVVLHRSVYGRHLFAVGSNEEAARFSGIDTRRVTLTAYVISGLLTAMSGVLFVFYTPSISPSSHANFYELYGIAAAVLGGCSLRGGEGSLIGIILGTILLRVLQNIQIMLGIPSSLEFAVVGAVILLGVLADQIVKTRRRGRV